MKISMKIDFLQSLKFRVDCSNNYCIIINTLYSALARSLLFLMPIWKNSQLLKLSMATLSMSLRSGNGATKLGSAFARPIMMLLNSTSKEAPPQKQNLSASSVVKKSSLKKLRASIAGVWSVVCISTAATSATTFPNIKHSPGFL